MVRRLLVVDDAAEIREIYRESLEQFNFLVEDASSSSEGIAKFQIFQPHLVICDYMMPGATGLEFLRYLYEAQARVPVLWVTGQGTPEVLSEAQRLGVCGFLEKPFRFEDLLHLVRSLIE